MVFHPLMMYISILFLPYADPCRDWRDSFEFEVVDEWINHVDGDENRCTKLICPGGTPEHFFLYIHVEPDWIVDHVQFGGMMDSGSFVWHRVESCVVGRQVWRAWVQDCDCYVQDGETFYIRYWCIHKNAHRLPFVPPL